MIVRTNRPTPATPARPAFVSFVVAQLYPERFARRAAARFCFPTRTNNRVPTPAFLLVFALIFAAFGCANDQPKITATINQNASLTGDLPANPLQWRVITSEVNKNDLTMSTLYGNDTALNYARTSPRPRYPNKSVLALVTWTQRPDERYYGAQIPDQIKSVEFVFVTDETSTRGHRFYSYQKYDGTPLKKSFIDESEKPVGRAAYLLTQRAAVMP